jgi:hypothetical protein
MLNNDPIPGFNPNAGSPIAATTAEQWTANYRAQPLTAEEQAGAKRIKAYYFGNEFLNTVQAQENCVGLRFYMGLEKDLTGDKSKDKYQLLVVGVDENGYDIVPYTKADGTIEGIDGIIGDDSMKCPDNCDPTSPLN